jgi:Tfp pilus assembly protein PilF
MEVYCPLHKIGFTATGDDRIVCPAGPHELAQRFPNGEFWEYCCDCQRFWPSNLQQGGRGESQCPICDRATVRRYLCNLCKLISVESDDGARRKAFSISADGCVGPSCPGCAGQPPKQFFEHDCPDSGTTFTTAFVSCPLCDKSLKPSITFPAKVNEVLKGLNGASQEVRFDAASNKLLPAAGGQFVLILSGHGARLPIVVPRQPRISTRQEYFESWYEVFDCDNPAPGEINILSPAVVESVDEGWKLREVGRIEITPDPVIHAPAPPPSGPRPACSNCGTIAVPDDKFCKTCGSQLRFPATPTPPEITDETNLRIFGLQDQPAAGPGWQETTAPAPKPAPRSNAGKFILLALLALVAFAIFIGVAVNLSSDSRPQRLEAAIASRNFFGPSGARELYSQLKSSGTSATDLARYEQKLLPLLTDKPNQMIATLSEPGGDDPPVGEWEEASRLVSWASELRSSDKQLAARAAYCAGRVAFLGDNYTQAEQQWARAAELDATWALPKNGIGLIYSTQRKDYSTARVFLFDAVRRDPKWAYPYNNIGTSYYMEESKKRAKDYTQAKSYYKQAVQLAPRWARPHSWLGDIAMRERDFDTAVAEFTAVLDPNATGTRNMDLKEINKQLALAKAQQFNME